MKTLVAMGQMTSTLDKEHNLKHCEALIKRAAEMGAKLISLPENFVFMGDQNNQAFSVAESLTGPSMERLRTCAQKNHLWVFLGGFCEKIDNDHRIYNTHVVLNSQGELASIYRKIHLFSVTLPDGSVYDEAKSVKRGDEVQCIDTTFFVAGLSICYDLRFPGLYAALRDKGAEVLFVPAAFTDVTGQAHWEVLLRARAIETQSYVVAAAQVGRHNDKRITYGHAMVIDPWGVVLARCGQYNDLAWAEIDLGYVRKLREDMPIWQHRRQFINES